MNKEDFEAIKKDIVWEQVPPRNPGGQQAGLPIYGWRLKHVQLGFEVYVRSFRSSTANKQMCLTLFELFLGDI